MQNIKYHALNIIAVILFSYVTALTANEIIKNSFFYFTPAGQSRKNIKSSRSSNVVNIDVDKIVDSGFFRVASDLNLSSGISGSSAELNDLKLLGTVTGPSGISRAMILKKGEKSPEIYRMWTDVHGYKLSYIGSSRVILKKDSEKFTLNLFEKKKFDSKPSTSSAKSGSIKKTVSRSEIQQKVMNNLDNAMKGIRAGPYRVNGKIEGYRLIRVRPYNILYKYGIRSGDIIKRINGKKIDSTEKLYNMWTGVKELTKLSVDVERGGQIVTFDLNISD